MDPLAAQRFDCYTETPTCTRQIFDCEKQILWQQCLRLLNWEIDLHKEIIDRFGRYPYRNEVLGRRSTPEEIEWLSNGKRFGQ